MNLEQTTDLYASVLRQLLPVGGYDTSPHTEALSVDVYAHAKLFAQADLDAKRILSVLEAIPQELINEYELEYGLPLKCTLNTSRTIEERLQILNWVRTSRNVLNRAYLEQLLAIFGVVLIDIQRFRPILCTASCDSPVNTEQLRYKVFLRLQYPMNADMSCIVENYLPGYLRIEWMVDMPWGDWILNSSVTVNTNGIAHYTAYKTNQREYYDSYANLDLTEAVVRSLHDSDMQQWQAVKDAANQLTGVTDWVFDNAGETIGYAVDTGNTPCTAETCAHLQYVYRKTTSQPFYPNPEAACTKAVQGVDSTYKKTPGYFSVNIGNRYVCGWVWTGYGSSGNVEVAYHTFKTLNPNYNPLAAAPLSFIAYQQVAQKIISNASSSNQAIALLAEAYLENVAKSIFNSAEQKQFVKLNDLLSQFELNKTLRT